MRTKLIVLWVKNGDPPSERAKLAAKSWSKILPINIVFKLRQVDPCMPEVSRVPCLHFLLDSTLVYTIEGEITHDSVFEALRRLG